MIQRARAELTLTAKLVSNNSGSIPCSTLVVQVNAYFPCISPTSSYLELWLNLDNLPTICKYDSEKDLH